MGGVRIEHIHPEEIHVHETITRTRGNLAWKFLYPSPERGMHFEGIFDTEVPETLVDAIDVRDARQNLGSYALTMTMSRQEVHDKHAVREALAAHLPHAIAQHDLRPIPDQLALW